jgi:23S rRNA (cytidine1920-2'-O)/16S rRNA (cytidine1409-2'-O)-methyltransferase
VTRPDGDLVLMVKPQFEVGKERLGKGGVVREPAHRAAAVAEVAAAADERGWGAVGVATSPLPGPAGNVEYFLWLRHGAATVSEADIIAEVSRSGAVGVADERL